MTAKSASAFRTISEVAEDLGLPQHVLRFWETKFPSIKPMKRGGGRRYYRPEDLDLLRRIRDLLYEEGYTIKGVQKLLRQQGPKGLVSASADAQAGAEDAITNVTSSVSSTESPSEQPAASAPEKASQARTIKKAISDLTGLKELLQSV